MKRTLTPHARATADAYDELEAALLQFPPFASPHEGYSVILEELDELWEEVKKHHTVRDPHALRSEALQVAAMAIRFAADLTDKEQTS